MGAGGVISSGNIAGNVRLNAQTKRRKLRHSASFQDPT
jgi:hypothetical protein